MRMIYGQAIPYLPEEPEGCRRAKQLRKREDGKRLSP